jgi:hypothetical protein
MPANFLYVVATVAIVLVAVRTYHFFRGKAMRAFADRRRFKYIGPPAPPRWWLNPAHFKTPPPLPGWVGHFHPSGQRIRQVWNVIQGQQNDMLIFIFDAVIGEVRGGHPCTLIACRTEQNPFGTVTSATKVIQSNGWTILHGAWFLWFSWTMGTKRMNALIDELQDSQYLSQSTSAS